MIQACYLLPELIRDSERERVLKKEGDSAIQREKKGGFKLPKGGDGS